MLFHLYHINLLPLKLDNEVVQSMKLLQLTQDWVVPSWVEEGSRIGGLLMGVVVRLILIIKEWRSIAKAVLHE